MLKRPVKIAIIRQRYAPYGGAEKFSSDYIRQIADAGHEVHIFANRWAPLDHPNIHFHKVPVIRFNAVFRYLSFAFFAAKRLKQERFDIIQSHERTFYQDIYRAGDGCHKEWLERRKKYASPLKKLSVYLNPFHWMVLQIEKYIFTKGRCKKIVAISEMVKRDIQKHYKVPNEFIEVVYNGVALQKFHPDNKALYRRSIREKFRIPKDALLILTIGSGFERKGLKFLIQAMDVLDRDDWRLMVIGKGNWSRYHALASKRARDKMIYLPLVDDVEQYYAAADVFVLPSIYEPFGNANLEALATGLPVITSRNSGAADIVTHKLNAMVLQDPGNPKEIAQQISFLFDPAVAEAMGRQARILAENFSQEENTRKMLSLYADLLQSK